MMGSEGGGLFYSLVWICILYQNIFTGLVREETFASAANVKYFIFYPKISQDILV